MIDIITLALARQNSGGGGGKIEVVTELPSAGVSGTIYLLPKEGTAPQDNLYEEWLYVNNAWERLSAEATVDLDNYYNKDEIDEKFDNLPPAEDQEAREMIQELESGKQDKLIQGSGINIAADGTISVSFADGLKEAY